MKTAAGIEAAAFERDGYLVVRGLCPPALREVLKDAVKSQLDPLLGPVEYEADVGYPGAPANRHVVGGDTPRRLLSACSRDPVLRQWATGPQVGSVLRELFGQAEIFVSQSHHNCVMTKHPGYSSATLWHQDIRYWSFDRPELISVWLALGRETVRNGALKVIPGSHRAQIDRGRLDSVLFLRPELEENRKLIEQARTVELEAGDTLFFHCRLFHAAGMNLTDDVKLSAVFTYHTDDNQPIPATRSAQLPSIPLG
ncbi:MAG: phytanoyl-CoA dioxygenase family protein [Pseudomonadales bacterium]|nr:phytanoyl-CoA dioxygenase family protein [Pseudomonadales bacterium]